MLAALSTQKELLCNTHLCSMSTAGEESGERPSPTLVPWSRCHGSKRSSSPVAARPVGNTAAGCSKAPAPSQASSIGFSYSGEAPCTPPQRQSTQPRVSSVIDDDCDVSPQQLHTAAADSPALTPAVSSSASAAHPPEAATATLAKASSSHAHHGSPALRSAAGAPELSPVNGGRSTKAVHQNSSSTHVHHRRTSGASGGGSAPRTASQRCKAARTLAAELMSALMDRPPQAAQITLYRQSLGASVSPSTPSPAPGGAVSAADISSRESLMNVLARTAQTHQPTQSDDCVPPPSPLPASSSSTHSFLEAVRNGRAKSSHAPLLPPSASTAGLAAATSPSVGPASSHHNSRLRSLSPNLSLPPGGNEEGVRRRPLELVPEDTATIPQLLSVLREISLSCAPLDMLGRSAIVGLSAQPVMNTNGSASLATTAAPTTPSTSAPVISAMEAFHSVSYAGGTSRAQRELDRVYEEQWQRVRSHLEVVRSLVLNGHELSTTLDDALGVDWRTAASAAVLESVGVPQGSDELPTHTPALAPVAEATAAATVIPVMPTPVDHDGPSSSSTKRATSASSAAAARSAAATTASQDGGETSSAATVMSATTTMSVTANALAKSTSTSKAATLKAANAAATTTTASTLNHKARPFHSRTPPSFQQQPLSTSQGGNGASPSLGRGGGSGGGSGGATTSGATNAGLSNVATSMKQLSESSPTYSPSQHVATFLERSTPPASGRLVDDGDPSLLNFPSTPLSEAAVPYQPSAPLVVSTSPRGNGGGNASASSSTPFHLESREEMLRRRSAAPNAFYASMTHSGATHYLGGPASAATTPGTFVPSSVPPGSPSFMLSGGGARSMPVSPLLSYGSPVTASQCPYDYILVLDFEATCEEHPPPNYLYEIIEFPVVVVDVRLQRVVAEFHRFVRPRHKVELSCFCKELTGMRQEDVDTAAPLEEVILQFERWFAHTVPPHARCVFATDGPMDMREFMYHHSVSRQGIRFPPLFYQYIDVKHTFACFFQCSQGKIKAMLEVLHVPFEGRLHSGLDDARNIASIVIGLLQYGCTLCEVPLNRLPLNGLLLSGGANVSGSGSAPLSLPPSTAAAGTSRQRGGAASPTYITAPYSVDEDEYSY